MSHLKTIARGVVPVALMTWFSNLRRFLRHRSNFGRSSEEVFAEIYKKNKWGGEHGEFYSGSGSDDERIVAPYIELVRAFCDRTGSGMTFVDIGCGDFRVGRRLLPFCSRYVGLDVVKALVERNRIEFGAPKVEFQHVDAVRDALPEGDVCFVRQVLQHLSNQQISTLLVKLQAYRWIFITEHYPSDNPGIVANKDKVHGEDIRMFENSGVYLDEPPFSLRREALRLVLEVPGSTSPGDVDAGVIRTFLYEPRNQ